jgi:hypothetical protein
MLCCGGYSLGALLFNRVVGKVEVREAVVGVQCRGYSLGALLFDRVVGKVEVRKAVVGVQCQVVSGQHIPL